MQCSNGEKEDGEVCKPSPVTYTEEELSSKLESLRNELTLGKKKTKKYHMSLISHPDERESARNIGYFGAVILITLGCMLLLLDITKLLSRIFARKKHQTPNKMKETSRDENETTC